MTTEETSLDQMKAGEKSLDETTTEETSLDQMTAGEKSLDETKTGTPTVKIAFLGMSTVGKKTLVNRMFKGSTEEVECVSVEFATRAITVKGHPVEVVGLTTTGHVPDIIPFLCDGAHAIVLLFDLSRGGTLRGLPQWYKLVHTCNTDACVFVVGTKFDLYHELPEQEKVALTSQAKRLAEAIGAPLVYCAVTDTLSINTSKLWQIIIGKVFGLKPKIEPVDDPMKPVVIL
jgi:GTP-binding protein of the ras superfamily involved in termination of M-phase